VTFLNSERTSPAANTLYLKRFLKVLNNSANAPLGLLKILHQILVKIKCVLQICQVGLIFFQ